MRRKNKRTLEYIANIWYCTIEYDQWSDLRAWYPSLKKCKPAQEDNIFRWLLIFLAMRCIRPWQIWMKRWMKKPCSVRINLTLDCLDKVFKKQRQQRMQRICTSRTPWIWAYSAWKDQHRLFLCSSGSAAEELKSALLWNHVSAGSWVKQTIIKN
jgi:hypothetical protein